MDVKSLIALAGGIEKLADRLGVNRVTVYDWRRSGKIPANRIGQISKEFSLPVDEVLKLAPEPKPAVPAEAAA